jgi:hypothetical protein
MQAKERRSPNVTQTTLLRPPGESERVLQALVQMATRIGKPFSEQRMQQFHDDLISYPVQAIEYFCDCWGRSAKVLPALSDALAHPAPNWRKKVMASLGLIKVPPSFSS